MSVRIQPMKPRHLPQVMDVELQAYPWPWTEAMFADSLRSGHLCYVMMQKDLLIGYWVAYVAVGECHILNVCIDPSSQGQGLGGELLQHGLQLAVAQGAEDAFLEVRRSNESAIRLYERCGFQQIGCRRNYYPADKQREDALMYKLDLRR